MAYDQGADRLYVIDSTADTLRRFNANGTAANFSALGSNEIDGEGTGDETPLGHLAFESNRQREQVAIDESGTATDGNVYVTQAAKDVVDVFSSSGEYLGALSESTEGGAFGEPCGVAVDDEGTVYVGDRGDDRIHVFDPAGAVPLNADNTASYATVTDPCTMAAGMGSTDGFLFVATSTGAVLSKVDAATGAVKYTIATGASTVSVDPTTGHVFVARNTGTSSQVDEYDASGAGSATLVSSFKPGQTVEGIATADSASKVYVARASTENVEVFGPASVIPDVVTSPPSSNTGVRATLAGTVNPDGVELDECFFEWGPGTNNAAYTEITPCAETPAEIGTGTSLVAVHADIDGLEPQGNQYHYRLVAVNPNATVNGSNQNFTTPNTVFTEAATGVTPTEATLNGTVNPDGATISECVFEWGEVKTSIEGVQTYPDTAPCVPGPGGITGTSPVAVSAELSGLHPGTAYDYRLKATYPSGPALGGAKVAQTTGPAILASWSEGVIRTEAILKADIDPEGLATTYHFEYGTTEGYGSETPELSVGADSTVHEVTRFLDGLEPGTTYHYRVVASNGAAVNEGPDRTFTTFAFVARETDCPNQDFRYGAGGGLPDCRAYEMVSPVDKAGGEIATLRSASANAVMSFSQTSEAGDKFTYTSYRSFGDEASSTLANQYMATRGPSGWVSRGISPPKTSNVEYGSAIIPWELDRNFQGFTAGLETAWLTDASLTPLSPNAVEGYVNFYERSNQANSYRALTTEEPEFVGSFSKTSLGTPDLQGFSRNGDHAVFAARADLTPDAANVATWQVYDYNAGQLDLVSVLPGGEADPGESVVGFGSGGQNGNFKRNGQVDNAVSVDGSRIYWTSVSSKSIYLRIDGEKTVPVGTGQYWTAASDGSKVLFSQAGDLKVADMSEPESPSTTVVASGVIGVLGAADDLSRTYFATTADLGGGAIAGQPNLYLDEEGSKTFVGTLSDDDVSSLLPSNTNDDPQEHHSRVTPSGGTLAFMSNLSLTGYDNTDAVSGEADQEVFIYQADADELICASCKPSGARPSGDLIQSPYVAGDSNPTSLWGAAWLNTAESQVNPAHILADDGRRLFFNSFDALVADDTNGVQDVYQWEAEGKGSCETEGGCISLISTGTNPEKSEFVEATPDGSSVYFETDSSIYPADPGLIDIYAARVGGGYPPPPAPASCVGDACQDVPEPPNDQTPASAVFRGQGDPIARRSCAVPAKRALRLSRRAKALRRKAKRSKPALRARRLKRRSTRLARRAKRLSRTATRCRRAVRRAAR